MSNPMKHHRVKLLAMIIRKANLLVTFGKHRFHKSRIIYSATVFILVGSIGVYLLSQGHAATRATSHGAENGTVSGNASTVSDANASGGNAVKFGASSGTASCPISTPNTPDGPDPWGGCFPGPKTTGVPAGTQLTTVSSPAQQPPYASLAPDNQGWIWDSAGNDILAITAGAVIDRVADASGVVINTGASVTIENSSINGSIRTDSQGTTTIIHSTINGGQQDGFPTIGIPNLVVKYGNIFGGFNEVNCYGDNCDVEQSYLHDQYDGGPADHEGGFFADGGNNDTLVHDTVVCTPTSGACTADVTFGNHWPINNFMVQKNLLLASPGSYYCAYPGPNSDPIYNNNGVTNVSWIDNVFQRGATGKCGIAAPVDGWFPSVCSPMGSCVWSGNRWDDGTALNEP